VSYCHHSYCCLYHCLSFYSVSFHYCVICPSSIYSFWLPIWYLQTFLSSNDSYVRFFIYKRNHTMQSSFIHSLCGNGLRRLFNNIFPIESNGDLWRAVGAILYLEHSILVYKGLILDKIHCMVLELSWMCLFL
jgi:hypothetical protein